MSFSRPTPSVLPVEEVELESGFPKCETKRNPNDKYIQPNPETITSFLYPCNVPRRNYQFEISKECFNNNCLVCLPTGTGKTFIAAVVIMNFHRWFPGGKILFLAPQRALVNQQIQACKSFTKLKQSEYAIVMGGYSSADRNEVWKQHSIFFATPQIVENDVQKGRLDPNLVTLVIIDEAHHARGNHSYSNAIRLINEKNGRFRVLGLSATPGNDINGIQAVIHNLLITKLIYKDDSDPEIAKHQHNTDIEIITVPLSDDESLMTSLLDRSIEYIARPLNQASLLPTSNPQQLTRGQAFVFMKKHQMANSGTYTKHMSQFGLLISLTSMREKLTQYGTAFLEKAINDMDNKRDSYAKKNLKSFGPYQELVNISSKKKLLRHPKLEKLGEILKEYFQQSPGSRTIVFTNYRDVAASIGDFVKDISGVRSSIFTGKGATASDSGQDGDIQQEIVNLFRKGNLNCIIATCVAEEGLDIGEVDLIICYDTMTSPLRTVQRMGRTGRKREGRVIFLMTEGIEEQNLTKAQQKKDSVKSIMTTYAHMFNMYKGVPMLPNGELQCIMFRPVEQAVDAAAIEHSDSGPYLTKSESFSLKKIFGSSLKYRRLKLTRGRKETPIALFSHATESTLLALVNVSIPEDIDYEISMLFGKAPKKSLLSDSEQEDQKEPGTPCARISYLDEISDDEM